jgi:hypothetical protein
MTTWSTPSAAIATTSGVPAAGASPGLVVKGSARVIAGLATRLTEEGLVSPPGFVEGWQKLRVELK